MQKLVSARTPAPEIEVHELRGDEMIVYRTPGEMIALLRRLTRDSNNSERYGFIYVDRTYTGPVFVGSNIVECINMALKAGKNLFIFKDIAELAMAIHFDKF